MALKCFLLREKLKFQHTSNSYLKRASLQHEAEKYCRNIDNIYSTGVAIGTDLFFLKLSWTIQLTAFWSITSYLLNGILWNSQQIMLSQRTFTSFVKFYIYLIFTSAERRRLCFCFRLSVCLSVGLCVDTLSQKVLRGFSWNIYQVFLIIRGRASSILGDLAKKVLPW